MVKRFVQVNWLVLLQLRLFGQVRIIFSFPLFNTYFRLPDFPLRSVRVELNEPIIVRVLILVPLALLISCRVVILILIIDGNPRHQSQQIIIVPIHLSHNFRPLLLPTLLLEPKRSP